MHELELARRGIISSIASSFHTPATKARSSPGVMSCLSAYSLARARWCLEMHKQWEADPVRFRFPEAKERPKSLKSDSPKRADRKHQKPEAQEPANDAGVPTPAPKAGFRTFPLGDGREVVFSLPNEPTIRELKKYMLHILTFAKDFDPTEPGHAQLYALARRED